MSRRNAASQHPIPEGVPNPAGWHLRVDGLVNTPESFTIDQLLTLGDASHEGSFTCVRGWEPGTDRWSGVPLPAVLNLVNVAAPAGALYAYSTDFRSLVPSEAFNSAILATHLDGEPLNVARGAPCRLIVEHPDCHLSMKWVERLELVTRDAEDAIGPRRPD
jgi:DMSO/TMAO reductase YedYZ molybdopterin-dependent catalytic subunit